jgi:hypothetical protein
MKRKQKLIHVVKRQAGLLTLLGVGAIVVKENKEAFGGWYNIVSESECCLYR